MNFFEKYKNIFYLLISPTLLSVCLICFYLYDSYHSQVETIELSCSGTFNISYNNARFETYKELGRLYTAAKDYPTYPDKNSLRKELVWRLSDPDSVLYPDEYRYPNQDGNPRFLRTVTVNKDFISVYSHYETDFEKDGAKNDSLHTIKINRVSGEWHDRSEHRTYWRNGNSRIDIYSYVGVCEKAVPKF